MSVALTLTGKRPNNTQFGLDSFTEIYKCDATADVVLTDPSVPQMGAPHADYPFMFVVSRYCNESGESASALDLTYMGTLTGDLPARQTAYDDAITSATSSRGSSGQILSSPISVQFYAPTTKLSFITYLAPGSLDTVTDPTESIRVTQVTVNDTNYTPTGILSEVASIWFSETIIDTISSQEIVEGKYWLNVETKTKTLVPFLFSATPGDYIVLYAPGIDYTIGNDLTITDGSHTAVVIVASLGLNNSVLSFTTSSNTFDYSTSPGISATGGSGSGAGFNNIHIA